MKTISRYLSKGLDKLLGLDFENDFLNESFSQIQVNLYLGARPKLEHLKILKDLGITQVLSCLDENKRSNVSFLESEFETLFVPLEDKVSEDIAPAIHDCIRFASKLKSPHEKLLVHCEAGVSRSASLVIALLMHREHKSFYDAFSDVYSARAKILPNIGFASQLQQLEHKLGTIKSFDGNHSSLSKYLCEICNAPLDIDSLQSVLEKHDYNAWSSFQAIFGDDIPRVIQGLKL